MIYYRRKIIRPTGRPLRRFVNYFHNFLNILANSEYMKKSNRRWTFFAQVKPQESPKLICGTTFNNHTFWLLGGPAIWEPDSILLKGFKCFTAQAINVKTRFPFMYTVWDKGLGEVRGYGVWGQQGQEGEGQGDYIWSQAPPLVLPSGPSLAQTHHPPRAKGQSCPLRRKWNHHLMTR